MTRLRGCVAHDFGVGWARGVGWDHDGSGLRIVLRHQVQVHLARDVARGDLDDDVLGAGSADVRDGDLERTAVVGWSACVGDGDAERRGRGPCAAPLGSSVLTSEQVASTEAPIAERAYLDFVSSVAPSVSPRYHSA